MKTPCLKAVLALAFGLGLSRSAHAVTTTDSLTVTIAPNAYYAVDIATGPSNLNLGTVDLAATTQTVKPATVTIQSTFATTDLALNGVITSGGTAWSFDENTASQETDSLAAWAVFTGVWQSSAPVLGAEFFNGTTPGATSDVIDNTQGGYQQVGDGADQAFESGNTDMDSLAVNNTAHLWLYFRLPPTSTTGSGSAQSIVITLQAEAP